MPRYTEIDAIIEDLRYDIELDARKLDNLDLADAKERERVQLDKVIKQNAISILENAPTADVVDKEMYDRLLENSIIIAEALNKYQTPMLGAACILDELEHLPAAQPERKTGKWVLNKDGNWACPFCEFDPYHDNMRGMNYCPNCGARMEGTP